MKPVVSRMAIGLAACVALTLFPLVARAGVIVTAGYDLFNTGLNGGYFAGTMWEGVSLNSWDFGAPGSPNVQAVGNTDTILQRMANVTALNTPITIDVVALQLRTVNQVSLGGGPVGYYYATLSQTISSSGWLQINSTPGGGLPGTFSDQFTVNIDLRFGGVSQPIIPGASASIALACSGGWETTTAIGVKLPGINYLLDGSDTSTDFWPGAGGAVLHHYDPSDPLQGHFHDVIITTPEPSPAVAMSVVTAAMAIFGGARRLRRT